MKVKLLRPARINHNAGEIVEVSPVARDFLVGTGSAVDVEADKKPKTTKRTKK